MIYSIPTSFFFFFNDTATTEIYTLSLHDALPICIELMNHWWILIVIFPTLTVPFCTWIMIGYFASIPKELDEAALIDGAGYLQVLTRIFLPVALPGVIAATIFAFTVSSAAFLYPMA